MAGANLNVMVTTMTTIEAHQEDRIAVNTVDESHVAQPDADGFWQRLSTVNRISLVLNVSTGVMAIGMVIMLLLITQSVRDLMSLEAKLSGLSQFETRLSARIETGDSALHGRLNDLDTQLSDLSSQATGLETRLATLATENGQMAKKIDKLERAAETASIAPADPAPDENRVVRYAPNAAQTGAAGDKSPPAPDTSRFQRSVTADGKVIYRLVN